MGAGEARVGRKHRLFLGDRLFESRLLLERFGKERLRPSGIRAFGRELPPIRLNFVERGNTKGEPRRTVLSVERDRAPEGAPGGRKVAHRQVSPAQRERRLRIAGIDRLRPDEEGNRFLPAMDVGVVDAQEQIRHIQRGLEQSCPAEALNGVRVAAGGVLHEPEIRPQLGNVGAQLHGFFVSICSRCVVFPRLGLLGHSQKRGKLVGLFLLAKPAGWYGQQEQQQKCKTDLHRRITNKTYLIFEPLYREKR